MKFSKTILIFSVISCLATQFAFAQSVEDVFEQYRDALEQGNSKLYESFVTQASAQKRYHMSNTRQRKNELACIKDNSYVVEYRTRNEAILSFLDSRDGKANPYIFTKEKGKWKIDFIKMKKRIVFGKKNKWRWR